MNFYKNIIPVKLLNSVLIFGVHYTTEVDLLIGDSSKAEKLLSWKAKTNLNELVHIMMKSDLNKVLVRGF